MIRDAFPAPLSPATTITTGMQQFDPVGIDHPQQGWGRQKAIGPRPMGPEQTEQARAFGQARKQGVVIADQPAIKGPFLTPFQSPQDADGDRFAGPQVGLGMLGDILHLVIYPTEQVSDKVFSSHVRSPQAGRGWFSSLTWGLHMASSTQKTSTKGYLILA